ncbi:hypothetical protein [Vreelandella sulfidaeris]
MFPLFALSFVYGLFAFNHINVDNPNDVSLAVIYYTFITLSLPYFIWSVFRKHPGGMPLRYRMNTVCLLGAMLAISFPVIIKTTSAMLSVMLSSII